MVDPAPALDYAHVTQRLGASVGDGPDPDQFPDSVPVTEGMVTFTPTIALVKASTDSGPVTIANAPIIATVDPDGFLWRNGVRGVWLVDLGSTKVAPVIPRDQAAYIVAYSGMKYDGQAFKMPTISINPVAGAELDLTDATPLPLPSGVTMDQLTAIATDAINAQAAAEAAAASVQRGVAGGVAALDAATGKVLDASGNPVDGASDASVAPLVTAGGPTETALSVAFAKPLRNTVVLFGDSITAQNGSGAQTLVAPGQGLVDPSVYVGSNGYWVWANAYLGQRATLVYNAGVGGNTSTQMLARIGTDVLAHPSDWVVLCTGANDIGQDLSLATVQANITSILDQLAADGRRVLILNAPPSSSYNTASRRAVLGGLNKWIQGLPLTRPNLAAVDVWRVLANPSTGLPATGMSYDGIVHPSDAGAQRMGRAIFDVLDPLMPRRPNRILGLLDPDNIIADPSLASGTAGWHQIQSQFTVDYTTLATERWSNKAVLTLAGITDTAEHGIEYTEPVTSGRYAAGDVVQASARFKWSNAVAVTNAQGTFRPWIRLYARLADNSFAERALAMFGAGTHSVQPVGDQITSGEVVASTFRITLPVNIANLYVGFGWQGMASGTLEISDVAAYKNA